jgi:hypothetical protein
MPSQRNDVKMSSRTRDAVRAGSGQFELRGQRTLAEVLAQQVEAALSPLLPHLTSRQAELVRSTLQASIEIDPVSVRLVANAERATGRSDR